jgi:hypothetical protein
MEVIEMSLTMKELERAFNEAKVLNFKHIGLKIQYKGFAEPEVHLIPRANFDNRLDFYKASYDANCSSYPEGEVVLLGVDYEDCMDAIEFVVEE